MQGKSRKEREKICVRAWASERANERTQLAYDARSCLKTELRRLINENIVNCSIANEKRYGRCSALLESPWASAALEEALWLYNWNILWTSESLEMTFEGRDALIVSMLICQCCDVILWNLNKRGVYSQVPFSPLTRPIYLPLCPLPPSKDPVTGQLSPLRNQIFLLL